MPTTDEIIALYLAMTTDEQVLFWSLLLLLFPEIPLDRLAAA